jgi:hypothetical protein
VFQFCIYFCKKTGLATFWATFSQTNLVTLRGCNHAGEKKLEKKTSDGKLDTVKPPQQGCQMVYFQNKTIWVDFGVSCDGRFWYILWPF